MPATISTSLIIHHMLRAYVEGVLLDPEPAEMVHRKGHQDIGRDC